MAIRMISRAAAVMVCVAAGWALGRLERVVVRGDSMHPTLAAGDRLVVWRTQGVRAGDLVVVPDPREPRRPLVKRVARADAALLTVRGDNPRASTDSRVFGVVPVREVRGRVVYRYHPPERAGWLH